MEMPTRINVKILPRTYRSSIVKARRYRRFYLPTISSSRCEARERKRCHISIVNMVDEELNIDVNEDIRAAIMQASIRPRKPLGISSITMRGYAMSAHDASLPQIALHVSGVEQPILSDARR